jgi:hypothetical protein
MAEENHSIPQEQTSTSEEKITAAQTQTASMPTETTTIMEIHKHPHHIMHKKKWGEYLLEFLMIFLAVFLGFVAENWREHFVDRKKEKVYMVAMVNDLKRNTARLHNFIRQRQLKVVQLDSLINLLTAPKKTDIVSIYYYGRRATMRNHFYPNDETFQQLRSTGGIRLIRNRSIIDSLRSYSILLSQLNDHELLEEKELDDLHDISGKIFDVNIFRKMVSVSNGVVKRLDGEAQALMTNDPAIINDYCLKLHYLNFTAAAILRMYTFAENKATNLITLIKETYHLE